MVTNDIISDISYTNKDFQTIYSELLDLVKKLTNKWDPSLSNESDPGVLLLKLNALIADKNNYNIDKNILECFPASVTQEGNARQLYDLLGYRMGWYKSAIVDLGFQLIENDITDYHVLNCFDTSVIDSSGEIVYTLIQTATLNSSDTDIVTVKAIEGTVHDYIISGSVNEGKSTIGLANLDNDLRLYFPESMIAENGIFIKNATNTFWDIDSSSPTFTGWKLVDNLASYPAGNKVYEFGVLPNSNTCYIQFPKDIATLIESGLNIKYTITNGQNGNIKANTLTAFYSDQIEENTDTIINDYIRIIQTNATTNGSDPESIDEAYNNYKKVIGTFNTLVTKRDYESYLYSYKNIDKNICSNCLVTDRTNSINDSTYIQTWNGMNDVKALQINQIETTQVGFDSQGVQKTFTTYKDALNAYNIIIHLLNPETSIYDKNKYDSTFSPNKDIHISEIESILSEVKSCNHDILLPTNTNDNKDIFNYLNLYTLKGQLITYHKVTKAEATEIEKNVMQALFKKYNARMVNFGEEIDYNTLIDVITNADTRIKSLIITNNYYSPVQQLADGTIKSFDNNIKSELIAKMVLSGNSQLFSFDDNFKYEFGQDKVTQIAYKDDAKDEYSTNIYSISSEAKIVIPKANLNDQNETNASVLKENEVLQIFAPNLVVTKEYSTYVKYYLTVTGSDANTDPIPADTDYQLKENEYLNLYYKDSNDIQQEVVLTYPSIIYSNIALQRNTVSSWTTNVDSNSNWFENSNTYNYLYTGKYIQVKEISQSKLTYKTKYYFKLNNPTNTLKINEVDAEGKFILKPYILQENEYFLYTNSSSTQVVLLGSGTKLSMPEGYILDQTLGDVDLSSIEVENIDWVQLGIQGVTTSGNITNVTLETTDLKIISLGQGTYFATEGNSITVTNNPQKLPTPFKYATILGTTHNIQELQTYAIKGIDWEVQSRLNINTSFDNSQLLETNHTITLSYDKEGTRNVSIKGSDSVDYITFNYPVVLSGGQSIDAQVLNYYGDLNYSLTAYTYKVNSQYNNNSLYKRTVNGLLTFTGMQYIENSNKSFILPFSFDITEKDVSTLPAWAKDGTTPKYNVPAWLLPVYIRTDGDASITISYSDGNVYLYDPLKENLITKANNLKGEDGKFYCLYIKPKNDVVAEVGSNKNLSITFSGTNLNEQTYINIGNITKISGINVEEIECADVNGLYVLSENSTVTAVDAQGSTVLHTYQNFENIIRHINMLDINNIFNWTYVPDSSDIVSEPTNPISIWNVNHIYNQYTLPKINFNNYKINVNSSSIKL